MRTSFHRYIIQTKTKHFENILSLSKNDKESKFCPKLYTSLVQVFGSALRFTLHFTLQVNYLEVITKNKTLF